MHTLFLLQELREQVEKLEAELEEYKKGVTALSPFRGRTQSWRGIITKLKKKNIAKWLLSVSLCQFKLNWCIFVL